jgi:hypothetical protein
MLAFGVRNHNSKAFRSPLGLAGEWPGVNKISAGKCPVCRRQLLFLQINTFGFEDLNLGESQRKIGA